MIMDKERFWQIIDTARESAGRWQDMYEPLVDELSKLDANDIVRFKHIFDEYQKLSYKDKLWAAATVMMNGCSDDGFDYFRGWLTAQGKDVFLEALADPDSLANLDIVKTLAVDVQTLEYMPPNGYAEAPRFEAMLYTPSVAYERVTGESGGLGIYYRLDDNPLTSQGKADIANDITYSADIDTKWFDWDTSREEIASALNKLVPNLVGIFSGGASLQVNATNEKEKTEIINTIENVSPDKVVDAKKPVNQESVLDKIKRAKKEPSKQPKFKGKSQKKIESDR